MRPHELLPPSHLLGEDGDAEGTHEFEDAALWRFVQWVAFADLDLLNVTQEADMFLEWAEENEDRTRWYA